MDLSNATYGLTWATRDAPLVEVGALTADRIGSLSNPEDWLKHVAPSQTLYSWAMNNHWHTNYKADQEGPTTFRYCIRPHAAYDAAAAQRFGVECSQPLIAVPAENASPAPQPRLRVEPADVIVSSFKPSADGKAWIVRLFNATDQRRSATLTWSEPQPKAMRRCSLLEEPGVELRGALDLPAWGMATLHCERP